MTLMSKEQVAHIVYIIRSFIRYGVYTQSKSRCRSRAGNLNQGNVRTTIIGCRYRPGGRYARYAIEEFSRNI